MKHTINESEFAYRIRQALDESTLQLDSHTLRRLHEARQKALQRVSTEPQTVPVWHRAFAAVGPRLTPEESGFSHWLKGVGIVAPLLALVIGVVGIKEWQADRFTSELAEQDFALLIDDTPIDALAHQGFSAYLHASTESL